MAKVANGKATVKSKIPMLMEAWFAVYLSAVGEKYYLTGMDKGSLKKLESVATDRGWEVEQASAFFVSAIDLLRSDRYWYNKISVQAVTFRVNEVFAAEKAKAHRERARTAGGWSAEGYREELAAIVAERGGVVANGNGNQDGGAERQVLD